MKVDTNSRIQAVIFDMDGVLVDTELYYMQQSIAWLREEEGIVLPAETFLAAVGAAGDTRWNIMREHLPTSWTRERYRDAFRAYLAAHPINYTKMLFQGVRQALETLKKGGYRLAVATSSPIEKAKDMLESCDMQHFFELVLTQNDITATKPDPEIYLTCLKKMGLTADMCVVVEDSSIGIQAAKRAGMCVFARRENRFPMDQSNADIIFEDYSDLYKWICQLNSQC